MLAASNAAHRRLCQELFLFTTKQAVHWRTSYDVSETSGNLIYDELLRIAYDVQNGERRNYGEGWTVLVPLKHVIQIHNKSRGEVENRFTKFAERFRVDLAPTKITMTDDFNGLIQDTTTAATKTFLGKDFNRFDHLAKHPNYSLEGSKTPLIVISDSPTSSAGDLSTTPRMLLGKDKKKKAVIISAWSDKRTLHVDPDAESE